MVNAVVRIWRSDYGDALSTAAVYLLKAFNQILLFSVIARLVAEDTFASVAYLASMMFLCANFMDFGYRLKIVQANVAGPGGASDFRQAISVKLLASSVIYCGFFVYVSGARDDVGTSRLTILVFFAAAFLLSNANFLIQYSYANLDFRADLYSNLIYTAILVGGVSVAILFSVSLLFYGTVFAIAATLMMLFAWRTLDPALQSPSSLSRVSVRGLIAEAQLVFPFAAHVFVSSVLVYVDLIFVERYLSESELAVYFTFNRFVYTSALVSLTISTYVYPYLAGALRRSEIQSVRSRRLGVLQRWTVVASIAAGVAALFGMGPALRLLFGSLGSEAAVFAPFGALLVTFRILGVFPSLVITSVGRQTIRVGLVCAAVVIALVAYPLVTPRFGLEGAVVVNLSLTIFVTLSYGIGCRWLGGGFFGLSRNAMREA